MEKAIKQASLAFDVQGRKSAVVSEWPTIQEAGDL
jgi:hypothetical protein